MAAAVAGNHHKAALQELIAVNIHIRPDLSLF
jgi:hypothetical protein